MSKPITLFSGYSQKENRITNYCLLILKMLYEENPKYLSEALGQLAGEDVSGYVGVQFRQQEKKEGSVLDGLIVQKGLTVYIETKNYDWFHDDQLINHLKNLHAETPGLKLLLALSNFEGTEPDRIKHMRDLCEREYKNDILLRTASFEDFLAALRREGIPKNLADAIDDLEDFCNEMSLLPSWRNWLDAVNCTGIPEDILVHNVYMCPATGGAYSHDRCRYFGMYRNKCVEQVAEIEAVVDVEPRGEAKLKWKNAEIPEGELCASARAKAAQLRPEMESVRVFLLGTLFPTEFRKDSRGGMQGSKIYFDIAALGAKDAGELAEMLKGKNWSEMG